MRFSRKNVRAKIRKKYKRFQIKKKPKNGGDPDNNPPCEWYDSTINAKLKRKLRIHGTTCANITHQMCSELRNAITNHHKIVQFFKSFQNLNHLSFICSWQPEREEFDNLL